MRPFLARASPFSFVFFSHLFSSLPCLCFLSHPLALLRLPSSVSSNLLPPSLPCLHSAVSSCSLVFLWAFFPVMVPLSLFTASEFVHLRVIFAVLQLTSVSILGSLLSWVLSSCFHFFLSKSSVYVAVSSYILLTCPASPCLSGSPSQQIAPVSQNVSH